MIRILISLLFTSVLSSTPTETEKELSRTRHKEKRFNFPGGSSSMMGGGGPFHGGGLKMGPMGGSHGPMTAPSMSGGSGMQGPHPPGGGMGMGGPQSPGHASLFNPARCLRQLRCPQWCLMIDANGCHSCPCGPGGGMMAVPGGSFMSGMPSMGGAAFAHVSQGTKTKVDCIGVELCKSTCRGHHTLGPVGSDGCPSCECTSATVGTMSGGSGYVAGGSNIGVSGGSNGGAGSGFGGGAAFAGGSGGGSGGFTPFQITGSGGGGVVTGSRPSVGGTTGTSTQTTYVVAPAKECRTESICKETCGSNFEIGGAGKDGCGTCICLKPSVTYTQGIQQIVQPAVQQIVTLTCPSLTCNYGCSIGYKCGTDGCPTCDCALPSGYATHEVVIQHKVDCVTSFSCPTSCEIGYTCGPDGCPTCDCLKGYVQTQTTNECIDCEYIDFLTPTPQSVTYVQTVPKQTENVYVTGGNECHDCGIKPQMVSYVRPRPQTQTVYVTNTNECHDCVPVKPQMVSYVRPRPKPRPQTQTVYVTGTQTECNGCEKPHTYYVQKPTPETVYVEKIVPEVEKSVPIYVDRPRPQKQTFVVTQTQTHSGCHYSNTCGSSNYVSGSSGSTSGGVIMNVLTGGSSHTTGGSSYSVVSGGGSSYSATGSGGSGSYVGGRGGGTPYGISGGSAVYTNGRVIGVSGTGSAYCPPMRHDCHPACIKYDDPHCRRCLC